MAKPSLLLVDADLRSLRVLEVSLKKAGFTVTTAVNGIDALGKVDSAHPQLIISDTHMPEMDGFELCRRLKTSTSWHEVPFIFLTGQTGVEDKIRGLELGVEDYLTKPIYLKEILTRVRIVLQKRERAALQEKRDSKTKFSGVLSDMAVVDLIQTVEISRKSGVIHFVHEQQRAAIFFRTGKVIDAEHGRLAGADAVYRLLQWTEGEFEVEFKNVRRKESIALSSQALLMEGMRRVDEWGRLLEQLPPLESVFEVVHEELAERLGDLPDETNGLLRLVDGRRSIMHLVDDWGVGDLPALETIARLYFEGMLAQVARTVAPPVDEDRERALVGWLEHATSGVSPAPSRVGRPTRPPSFLAEAAPPLRRDSGSMPAVDAPFGGDTTGATTPAAPLAPEGLLTESQIRAGQSLSPHAQTTQLRAVQLAPEEVASMAAPQLTDPLASLVDRLASQDEVAVDGQSIEDEAPQALGLPPTPSAEMAAVPAPIDDVSGKAVPLGDPVVQPVLEIGSGQTGMIIRSAAEHQTAPTPQPGWPEAAAPDEDTTRHEAMAPEAAQGGTETMRSSPPPPAVARVRLEKRPSTPLPILEMASPRVAIDARNDAAGKGSHDYSSDPTPLPPPMPSEGSDQYEAPAELFASETRRNQVSSVSSNGAARLEVSGTLSVPMPSRAITQPPWASIVTILPSTTRDRGARGDDDDDDDDDATDAETGKRRTHGVRARGDAYGGGQGGRWVIWGGAAALVVGTIFFATSHHGGSAPPVVRPAAVADAAPMVQAQAIPDAGPPPADAGVRVVVPPKLDPPVTPTNPQPTAAVSDDPKALVKQARRRKAAGHADEAMALVEKALAADPGSVDALLLRAEILLDRGDRPGAIAVCDGVIAAHPRSADAWMMKGLIYYDEGDAPHARAAFEKYLEIRPKGARAENVRVMLESL